MFNILRIQPVIGSFFTKDIRIAKSSVIIVRDLEGDVRAFQEVAGRFLQLPLTEVERVDPSRLEIAA